MIIDDPSLGHLVNRTARLLRKLADQRLAPLGLSSGALPVLTALLRGEALSQKVLTERAGIEQPTMAATLNRMERDGLVERQADPCDGRSAFFVLTAKVRDQADEIGSVLRRLNQEVLQALTEPELKMLRKGLTKVIDAAERAIGE